MTLDEMRRIVDLTPYPRPVPMAAEEREEACDALLHFLLREQGLIGAFSASYEKKRSLLRGYFNRRMPLPFPPDLLSLQDRLLYADTLERGVVPVSSLRFGKYGIALWQGDITRLETDGIVNAANCALLGCFAPNHSCIDNAIHSCAGIQLRSDCAKLMAAQGVEEEAGGAKITRAYNLPSRFVLHTVGPMVGIEPTREDRAKLRSCYLSCLDLAEEAGLDSLAFCCIATGVFGYPNEEAAEVAAGAVVNWKIKRRSPLKVVFNTFGERDTQIYSNILSYM